MYNIKKLKLLYGIFNYEFTNESLKCIRFRPKDKIIESTNGFVLYRIYENNFEEITNIKENFCFYCNKIISIFQYKEIYIKKDEIVLKNDREKTIINILSDDIIKNDKDYPNTDKIIPKDYKSNFDISFDTRLMPVGIVKFYFSNESNIQKAKYIDENELTEVDIYYIPIIRE